VSKTFVFSQLSEPQPKFHSYTVEDGLPSSETYFIHQDRKGFIWICTDRGVVKFDGYNFKLFTKAQGLTDNVVFKIYEDFKGRIWFLTYNSKLCYFENNRIVQYKYNYLIEKNGLGFISVNKNLFVDSNETVFFSELSNGLIIIDKKGNPLQEQLKEGMTITKRSNQIFWTFKQSYKGLKKSDLINVYNDIDNRRVQLSSTFSNSRILISSTKSGDLILLDGKLFNLRTNQLLTNIEDAISINIIDKSLWIGRLKGGVYNTPQNLDNLSPNLRCF
jgi:ligand-binding sensor domain-containing protein